MTHGIVIQKKTRSLLAKRYAEHYLALRDVDPTETPSNVDIADSIGTIRLPDEPPVDASRLLLDATFDDSGRLDGVEVRNESGMRLFVERVQDERKTGMKTEIVFINEGKGTVRKYEITVPTNTV